MSSCQICVPLVGPSAIELENQWKRAALVADAVEIRLDLLDPSIPLEQLSLWRRFFNTPAIWTLRSVAHGGRFSGREEERCLALSQVACELPDYIDIEADLPTCLFNEIRKRSPTSRLIASSHFQKQNYQELFLEMSRHAADFYKIAIRTECCAEAVGMAAFCKEINEKSPLLIAIAIGQRVQACRVLAPLVGAPFTFVALSQECITADGQLTCDEMLHTYRFRKLSKKTTLYGLIGSPVDKSRGHFFHNQLFDRHGIDALYLKWDVQPEEILPFFKQIQRLPVRGLSVTMPLKSIGITSLEIQGDDPNFQVYNTLCFEKDNIRGYNTDGIAALSLLGKKRVNGKKMVILGAGSTAQAIAKEALGCGAKVFILNRTLSKAEKVGQLLKCPSGELSKLNDFLRMGCDFLVQATSSLNLPLTVEQIVPQMTVLEVISHPVETPLIQLARSRGCLVYTGVDLFLQQAVGQWHHWFPLESLSVIE